MGVAKVGQPLIHFDATGLQRFHSTFRGVEPRAMRLSLRSACHSGAITINPIIE
jgi:hypothetical protein